MELLPCLLPSFDTHGWKIFRRAATLIAFSKILLHRLNITENAPTEAVFFVSSNNTKVLGIQNVE